MKQYFTEYKNWEDWQNGMWKTHEKNQENELISNAINCLKNPLSAMQRVVNDWPVCTKVNLSDKSQNRKSWLGQAACCIVYGIPEHLTRKAWMMLTDEERINANEIAKKVIEQWEKSQ